MNDPRIKNLPAASLQWIVRLPRWARIALAALFALAVTLVVTPIVDFIYLTRFYDPTTLMVPALISVTLGVVFYFIGWRLMIGYAGETPAARPALLWYFGAGLLICVFALVLVVNGAFIGTAT